MKLPSCSQTIRGSDAHADLSFKLQSSTVKFEESYLLRNRDRGDRHRLAWQDDLL